MKLRISRTLLVAAAALVLGSAAYAQEVNLRAKVPFDFVLADKVYPAGEYALQTVMANNSSLYLKHEAKAKPALLLTDLHTAATPAKRSELIFHHMGGSYFLYQVWVAGSEVGREFPKSKTEVRMAMNGTKSETVSVAANITQ
jgi:hypothetical protein